MHRLASGWWCILEPRTMLPHSGQARQPYLVGQVYAATVFIHIDNSSRGSIIVAGPQQCSRCCQWHVQFASSVVDDAQASICQGKLAQKTQEWSGVDHPASMRRVPHAYAHSAPLSNAHCATSGLCGGCSRGPTSASGRSAARMVENVGYLLFVLSKMPTMGGFVRLLNGSSPPSYLIMSRAHHYEGA